MTRPSVCIAVWSWLTGSPQIFPWRCVQACLWRFMVACVCARRGVALASGTFWAGGTMFVRKVHAPARSCAFVFGRHAHTGAQEVIAGVHLLAPPCRLRSTRAVSPLSGPADVTLPQPCPPFPRQICKEHKDHGVRKEERVEGDASQASWVIRVLDHEHAISCCCYPLESINCSHTQMVTGRNLPTLVQRYVAHPIAQQSVDCTKNRTATGWCYM